MFRSENCSTAIGLISVSSSGETPIWIFYLNELSAYIVSSRTFRRSELDRGDSGRQHGLAGWGGARRARPDCERTCAPVSARGAAARIARRSRNRENTRRCARQLLHIVPALEALRFQVFALPRILHAVITVLNPAPFPSAKNPLRRELLLHSDFICPNELEAQAITGLALPLDDLHDPEPGPSSAGDGAASALSGECVRRARPLLERIAREAHQMGNDRLVRASYLNFNISACVLPFKRMR